MRKILLPLLALACAGATACGRSEVPTEPPPTPTRPTAATGSEPESEPQIEDVIAREPLTGSFSYEAYAYDCNGRRVTVRPGDEELVLEVGDRSVVLPQVEAAAGARCAADGDTFWGKGMNSAMLTLDGEEMSCELNRTETPWVDARARGATFRAVGQEPGWHIEVHPERLVMVYQYGERQVVVPNPGVVEDPELPIRRWHAITEAHELLLVAQDRACTDVMSGTIYPVTADVTLDGRNYSGCGRDLD